MNRHLLDAYNDTLDGDEWANCQSWRFAVAHVLWHMGWCPDGWGYSHGLCFIHDPHFEDENEREIYYLFTEGRVTVQDLIEYKENILDSLRDILVREGKDY